MAAVAGGGAGSGGRDDLGYAAGGLFQVYQAQVRPWTAPVQDEPITQSFRVVGLVGNAGRVAVLAGGAAGAQALQAPLGRNVRRADTADVQGLHGLHGVRPALRQAQPLPLRLRTRQRRRGGAGHLESGGSADRGQLLTEDYLLLGPS